MSLPDRFGRYQVLDILGQGAMGLVYKAVDPVIERAVAVKVIQAGPGLNEAELAQMSARFEQEFRSAGALSHSGIVTVYDVGKEGDLYYIAMEYVEGRGLDVVLAERRVLPPTEVGDLARDLAGALDYAHGQGVVHRDIKPANVLIDVEGRAKITDFGLAKLEATTLTRTGALVGTPAYMSPEQVGGQTITGKTDQFSLAILLYQALTSERPFTGDNPSTIMYRIAHEEPLPARQLNKSLPEAVDAVLLTALQKDPGKRFASCMEMADGLRQALGGDPFETVAEVPVEPLLPGDVPAVSRPSPPTVAAVQVAATVPDNAAAGSAQPPSISVVQSPTPRWLLALGIVLPSIALLAMVAWFVSTGIGAGVLGSGLAGGELSPPPTTQDHSIEPATEPAAPEAPEQSAATGNGQAGSAVGSSELPAAERAGSEGRLADRVAERIEAIQGIPPQLQELMEAGQIQTGRVVVNSVFPVGLRLVPASRFQNMSPQIRERLLNASAEERRRLMAGFFIAQSTAHDIQLPAGNWRVTMMTPPVFFYHEEQIVLRDGQTFSLGERVPSELVRVRITSDPPRARVRVGNMPAVPTPFDGLVVVGNHRFEFIWNDARAVVPVTIDRDGQQVVGRQQP